jgi:hypothetical protein
MVKIMNLNSESFHMEFGVYCYSLIILLGKLLKQGLYLLLVLEGMKMFIVVMDSSLGLGFYISSHVDIPLIKVIFMFGNNFRLVFGCYIRYHPEASLLKIYNYVFF